jgi:RNA polymerase sigma-70 factor, ECF subfamily
MTAADPTPQRQDDAEFLALLGQHEHQLAACVHMIVPRWQEAEDVLQEVRLTLWREFPSFRPGSNFLAWARTVARYAALNHLAKDGSRTVVFSDSLVQTVLARPIPVDQEEDNRWVALLECGRKLGPAARDLIRQVYVQKRKIKDVALSQGRSVNGTHVLLSRIRHELAECIQRRLREVG